MDRVVVTVVHIDIATGHARVLHELLADRRAIRPVYRRPRPDRSCHCDLSPAALHCLRLFYDGIHQFLLWDLATKANSRYQRRSKRLRSTIATEFIKTMKTKSTMIAADVRSMKARSGLSAQR